VFKIIKYKNNTFDIKAQEKQRDNAYLKVYEKGYKIMDFIYTF